MTKQFTHLDQKGNPSMVDVGQKTATHRRAVAEARVWLPEPVLEVLEGNEIQTAKGPVFRTAIIAGIMAAKKTGELIPLCHPLGIEHVDIQISMQEKEAVIRCEVSLHGKTGVEMEALTGASIASLTIYDMCKALSHDITVSNLRLIEKTGGKNDFQRK
jgi:cyclic pyranopterin monophosphate synthase